jgi:hypothetical protein
LGRGEVHRVLVRRPVGKRQLGRPWLDSRIILKWVFKKENCVLNG